MPRKFNDLTEKRLYQCWADMKQRCYNPKLKKYPLYGGRGIKVCPEWVASFKVFYAWALDNGYKEDLTLDRMNGDQDYCPENCRWATYKEQANNLKSNHRLEILGTEKTLTEWAEYFGVPPTTFNHKVVQLEKQRDVG